MRKLPKKRFLEVAGRILRNKMAKEAIYPFYCSFKLTRRCNFTCSFCNCWHIKNHWKDMPTEDVKAVLDNLARSSVIVCSFEGGDPLVRDDIEELLKYQYQKPWYLLFTTSERDMQARYPMPEYGSTSTSYTSRSTRATRTSTCTMSSRNTRSGVPSSPCRSSSRRMISAPSRRRFADARTRASRRSSCAPCT